MSGLMSNSGGGGDVDRNHEGVVVGGVGSSMTGGGGLIGEEESRRNHEEVGDRSSAGNRWPRQETLALLKIRSDMDVTFRDSTLKGPLWEEVSRKLADLGYHRNAKKCKEKFENVYKYHKRTKEGRSTKQDGKTYRFFDQLEALDNQYPSLQSFSLPMKIESTPPPATTPAPPTNPIITSISQLPTSTVPSSLPNISTTSDFITTTSTSSSFSSAEESEGTPTQKKKRKLTTFFENLMKEVIQKQEMLQKKFMEAIEKHEHQRMVREEQWKMQELVRINREHDILVQERSIAAAKDAAVIAFLQKISSSSSQQSNPNPVAQFQENPLQLEKIEDNPPPRSDNNGDHENNFIPRSIGSSRWPKVEIEALIRMRTSLEVKYQDNGPKGPLWEEISAAMKKLGYNRSAKRCKEKWENINKYYKKVKESNKKRPEDSKTCPYFEQLEELYREKNNKRIINSSSSVVHPVYEQKQQEEGPESLMEDQNNQDDQADEDHDAEEEDEDGPAGGYEINVRNTSMVVVE
ncbi:SANT/Myb domain [Macleaya cordata]|uniref:SANT/Myb domain n=1 Tax=Macleaya cordata TaxID=56857 RepID=A0A200QBP7_MACCD|nr:SANT/Myb domain [Macleaya cordata]